MSEPTAQARVRREVERLEALVQRQPDASQFYLLADLYTRLGRFEDAVATCESGLQHHSEHVAGHIALGRALFGLGRLKAAVQVLKRAIRLPDGGAEPFRLLGEILLRRKAPTAAVMLMRQAISLGHDQPLIHEILARAQAEVERESTNRVVQVDPTPRGIGNRAVAGTIGVTGERSLPELNQAQVWSEIDDGSDVPDWSEIDGAWLRRLEADSNGPDGPPAPGADGSTDSGEYWGIGMPPLPSEVEDSGILPLEAMVEVLHGGAPGLDELVPATGETGEHPALDDAEPTLMRPAPGPVDETAATAVIGELDAPTRSLPQSGISPAADDADDPDQELLLDSWRPTDALDAVQDLGPDELEGEEQVTAELEPEEQVTAELEPGEPMMAASMLERQDHGAERSPAATRERSPVQQSLVETQDIALDGTDTPAGFPPAITAALDGIGARPRSPSSEADAELSLDDLEPAPGGGGREDESTLLATAQAAPRRRRLWLLWLLVLLTLGAGAGTIFWIWHQRAQVTRSALAATRVACSTASRADLHRAAAALRRALVGEDIDQQLKAAQEVVAALLWLHHSEGAKQPEVTASHVPWGHVLARSLVKLAAGDTTRARSFLQPTPADELELGLRHLYLAWADWLEGRRSEAGRRLDRAAATVPNLVMVWLLRGQMALEVGDAPEAALACRRALAISPRHGLAGACLAAALIDGATPSGPGELKQLLARPAGGALVGAWRVVLRAELAARAGQLQQSSARVMSAINGVRPGPALLLRACSVLVEAGDVETSLIVRDKLEQVRASRDPAILLLEARLLARRGLVQAALQQLPETGPSEQVELVRAQLMLEHGSYDEVLKLLQGHRTPLARLYREAARVLQRKTLPTEALEQIAAEHPLARLYLGRAYLARGGLMQAEGAARVVAKVPRHQQAGLTLLARVLLARGDQGAALKVLEQVIRESKSTYLPALELKGRVLYRLARFRASERVLGRLLEAGWRDAEAAAIRAKAQAMAGSVAGAAASRERAAQLGASEHQLAEVDGFLLVASGRPEEAEPLLRQASKTVVSRVALARALLGQRRFDDAEQALLRAVELDPVHPLPHLWLGRLLVQQGDRRAASELAVAVDRAAKRRYFGDATIVDASLRLARYELGRGRNRRGAAIGALRRAVRLVPRSARLSCTLGKTLVAAHRTRSARKTLVRCAALDASDAEAHYLLGTAVKAPAKVALGALQRFLQLRPDDERAPRARRRLARLRRRVARQR